MDVKLQSYKKKFNYSYSSGVYPTIELLTYHPETVIKVLISGKGERNEGVVKILDLCRKHNIKTEKNDGMINKLTESENNYALGVFNKFTTSLSDKENHLVLVNPSDMGNLGTIIRTMAGFNLANLAVITPAADIFHPKVIRASMGAFFQMNFQMFDSFDQYRRNFTRHNFYPFMTSSANEIQKIELKKPASLIFGNEGSGLAKEYLKTGTSVKIAQSEKVDSLNLSIAVGIALYSFFVNK
jgi:TrmH family RNA methyltransferase